MVARGAGRVGSDQEVLKSRGSGRVGSGQEFFKASLVGSGRVKIFKNSRVGSGQVNRPDPAREV